jgi:hypothetical protein
MRQDRHQIERYRAVLLGPDELVLDTQFFAAEGDAINYAKHDGPEVVERDVVKANIYTSDGKLVWSKANLKD